jgi:hypothetical protein
MEVSFTGIEGWDIRSDNGGKTLTAAPSMDPDSGTPPLDLRPGTPAALELRVENPQDPAKTTRVRAEFMPLGAVFTRPAQETEYRLVYYDENGAAGLDSGGVTAWYYIADPGLRKTFNAIYGPNARGSGPDVVEQGKAAIPYTTGISEKVLGLFNITVAPSSAGDRIEIRGDDLPNDAEAGPYRIIVIDIGVPEEDNGDLPAFSIPNQGLGAPGEDYSHIRLRVNRGAYLHIEADNSAYMASGRGFPCPPGRLTGASVEIMGDGKFRDGAYEGFPLGQGGAIIARLGSWLAAGPESSFGPEKTGYLEARDKWYNGWLIGPAAADPRIQWDAGDQNGSYIEIREARLAFDVHATIRKSLALEYSLWFINGPTLTIAAAEDGLEMGGRKGLFAKGGNYRFYGTASVSGGQNPARPAAKIIMQSGSSLSRSFLTDDPGAAAEFITASDNTVTIINQGRGAMEPVYYTGESRGGYLNWSY